mmetsp:Transcript_38229/g.96173  ORF Transcript_38229/g.96173 Transcript_38229/m.96173 type:complete len:769 (-) Transcript_38229:36-2342(-)
MGATASKEEEQIYLVPDTATKTTSPIIRNILSKDSLVERFSPDVTTLYENFRRGFELNPSGNCLGTRGHFPLPHSPLTSFRTLLSEEASHERKKKREGLDEDTDSDYPSFSDSAASKASDASVGGSDSNDSFCGEDELSSSSPPTSTGGDAPSPPRAASASASAASSTTPPTSSKPYIWASYREVYTHVRMFAASLIGSGLKPGAHLGLYAANRPEWVIAEQACYIQSMIPVALYDTLGEDAVIYIINHAKLSTVVCSADKTKALLKAKDSCPVLVRVIQMEEILDAELVRDALAQGIELVSMMNITKKGISEPSCEDTPPKPDDPCTIMYTSGTTGVPKGVVLTHANVISACAGVGLMGVQTVMEDVHISYLPLAHIFERLVETLIFSVGASVGFYQGDVKLLFDDINELRPTIFPSVPRLFNRVHDKVQLVMRDAPMVKRWLFNQGVNSKRSYLDTGTDPNSYFWDRLLFDRFKEKLGGRVRMIITGSAPISKEVFQFLQICFSCPVVQGLGLTETAAALTLTFPSDFTSGHCGVPVPCCEMRLVSVPDMGYLVSDEKPRGEVCVRGNNIFREYYCEKEKTDEVLDSDGWFHTGDIGQIVDGKLQIIDRKKNIFKLAQGEYIAAEKLESVYSKNLFVEQIFVYGDSLQPSVVGIVVPNAEYFIPHLQEMGLADSGLTAASPELEPLYQDPKVRALILNELLRTAKEQKLRGFEFLRSVALSSELFSVENDLLTPTFKNKRPVLKKRFEAEIQQLYDEYWNYNSLHK